MTRLCDYCKQEYSRRPSVIGKFCSNQCKGKGNLAQLKNLTYKLPKGNVPWNKGLKGFRAGTHRVPRVEIKCRCCSVVFVVKESQSTRIYCSIDCSSNTTHPSFTPRHTQKHSLDAKKKMSLAKKGKRISPATEFKRLPDTPEKRYIRNSSAYRKWRESVFERDDYTCQHCLVRGGKLEADHIKPFSLFPDLRLDVANGRTLCKVCHTKTPTYRKNQYQLKAMFAEELKCV